MSPDSSTGIPRAAAFRRRMAAMAPPALEPPIGSSTTWRIPHRASKPMGRRAQMMPGTRGGGTPAASVLGPVEVEPPLPPPVVVVVVVVVEEGVPPPKLPPPVNVPPPPVEPALLPPPVDTVGGVLGTPVAELENAMVETTRFFVSLYSLLGVLG